MRKKIASVWYENAKSLGESINIHLEEYSDRNARVVSIHKDGVGCRAWLEWDEKEKKEEK